MGVSGRLTGFYLHGGLEGGGVRVVRQALAITLLFNTQQDLDVLTVLVAAGLLVTLHPRLDLVLPQRRVLRRLLLWSCTLRGRHSEQNSCWPILFPFRQNTTSGLCCLSVWLLVSSAGVPLLWRTSWTPL